ncbi:MAG: hypothetical protein WBD28_09035 [Candidatus Zixiibacteriota bacterium]
MFNKRILRFVFISTLLFLWFSTSFGVVKGQIRTKDFGKPATELEAKLILYKDQYLLREPIWVKITVTNRGVELPVLINIR